jgi:filamentous hemagglutinin
MLTRRTRIGGTEAGVYPVEVERTAHQTVTETRLLDGSGAPALMASGAAMRLNVGTLLNNDNGQIAAGGNLIVNGAVTEDGSNDSVVRNTSTQLSRTYAFANISGYGSARYDPSHVVETVAWSNPSITQPTGSAGGTITSNRAVVINARQVTNNSVASVQGPTGASPSSFGLGEDVAPYAGSAADRAVTRSGALTKSVAATPGVAGAPGSAALTGTVRTVAGARAGALSATLPTSGLYHIAPQATQPYLVETDQRFTSYQNFISSDYLLERLGIRPEQTGKRLGDGFYEQRLVLSQATALTGQRYLADHSNAEEEYIALMNSGVAYAQRFGLVPGIALSDSQMAALTSDMVWLVEQTVSLPDGSQQTVLAPQVYLARNPRITPTGALIAGDAMQIDATDVDNRGGTLSSNRQLFITADNDIDNSAGSIQGGDVRLHADKDIIARSQTTTERIRSGSSTSTLTSVAEVSRISATGNLVIDAGQDMTLQGAQISAGGNAGLAAGRRLSIGALETGTQYSAPGVTTDAGLPTGIAKAATDKLIGAEQARALTGPGTNYQSQSSHQVGSTISSGGDLAIVSLGDIAIEGSRLSSGRDMLVAGKGRVDIVNTTDSSSLATSARAKGYRGSDELHSETVNGSRLQAEGNVTVYAGAERDASGNFVVRPDGSAAPQDLTVRASSIAAGMNPDSQGRATLRASGNVDIIEAGTQFDSRRESRNASSNGWSSTQSHDLDNLSARTAQGSVVTGTEVNVIAGRDLNLRGSAVAGSRDVALSAEGDIHISAAQERQAQYLLHEERQDGVFASNGGLTLGGRSLREESNTTAVTESRLRSMVGSTSGNVGISAKGNVSLTGSDVVAGRDVNITGKNVYLDAGTDSSQNRTTQDSEQSGLSVTLSGAIPTAARAAGKALDRKVQSQDSRIAALQGVKAGMTINSYLDGVKQAEASDAANAASGEAGAEPTKKPVAVKVAVTMGSSQSRSVSESRQQAQSGSSIVGVNNVNINATGSGARDSQGHALDGDITGVGVQITGKNVSLDAARDIDIRAAQQSASNRSNSASSSYGVGVGFAVGGSQNGVTVELAAATGEGRSNYDSTTYQASQIAASNTLRMNSGRDMNLLGAQARGDRVEVKVGRDLNIGSTQDKEVHEVTQQSAGFNLSVCVPPICYGSAVEGSASYNRADTDSKYRSVQEQSGVYAGQGGYDIAVKGNTDLVGAVIASAAEPEHNRLKTGTLTMRDLDNEAAYSASSVGISATTSSGTGKAQGSGGVLPNVGVSSSGSATGASRSAIGPGSIDITDEAGQVARTGKSAAQTVTDTNRDTAKANGAIDRIFDQQKVQQQQELAQLVGGGGLPGGRHDRAKARPGRRQPGEDRAACRGRLPAGAGGRRQCAGCRVRSGRHRGAHDDGRGVPDSPYRTQPEPALCDTAMGGGHVGRGGGGSADGERFGRADRRRGGAGWGAVQPAVASAGQALHQRPGKEAEHVQRGRIASRRQGRPRKRPRRRRHPPQLRKRGTSRRGWRKHGRESAGRPLLRGRRSQPGSDRVRDDRTAHRPHGHPDRVQCSAARQAEVRSQTMADRDGELGAGVVEHDHGNWVEWGGADGAGWGGGWKAGGEWGYEWGGWCKRRSKGSKRRIKHYVLYKTTRQKI